MRFSCFFGGFCGVLARGDCPRCEWIIQDFIPTFFFVCDEGKRNVKIVSRRLEKKNWGKIINISQKNVDGGKKLQRKKNVKRKI